MRICGKCGLPIHPNETGLRHYGFYSAHSENRCYALLRAEAERLTRELAEGEAGIQRRLLGNTKAIPTFMVDGTLPRALEELLRRIEACGASLELTAASSLCADLVRATKGDTYAMTLIDAALRSGEAG